MKLQEVSEWICEHDYSIVLTVCAMALLLASFYGNLVALIAVGIIILVVIIVEHMFSRGHAEVEVITEDESTNNE